MPLCSTPSRSDLDVALGLLLVLAGCEGGAFELEPRSARVTEPAGMVSPSIAPSPTTVPAADPSMPGFDGWPIVFDVRTTAAAQRCRVRISRRGMIDVSLAGAIEGRTCTVLWDGRGPSGVRVPAGPVDVEGQLTDARGTVLARAADRLEVVRVGIDRIELSGEPGARQPLLYRATGGRRDGWTELSTTQVAFAMAPDDGEVGASALDRADGTPRPIPAPWDDLTSPPLEGAVLENDVYNLPTAWVVGSRIDYVVRLTSDIPGVEGGGSPRMMQVRVAPPAFLSAVGDTTFRDGAVVRMSGAPVVAVDRYDLVHDFGFEARRPGGEWQPMPGAFRVTLRMYGLVAAPVFARETIPYRPWVDVVDTVTRWVAGRSSEPAGVGAAIVRGIYESSGLRYDRRSGAAHYTLSIGPGQRDGSVQLQAFQERRYGNVVNCSDTAGIVATYANMVGLDFRYRILTPRSGGGFRLHYLQGIGSPTFTYAPFDSGRNSFSYHAIVNSRDVKTWDATLAVDGDGMPSAPPFVQLLVTGLEPMRYLEALSPEAANIVTTLDDRVRIQ